MKVMTSKRFASILRGLAEHYEGYLFCHIKNVDARDEAEELVRDLRRCLLKAVKELE